MGTDPNCWINFLVDWNDDLEGRKSVFGHDSRLTSWEV